jgi:hypothetical protein
MAELMVRLWAIATVPRSAADPVDIAAKSLGLRETGPSPEESAAELRPYCGSTRGLHIHVTACNSRSKSMCRS